MVRPAGYLQIEFKTTYIEIVAARADDDFSFHGSSSLNSGVRPRSNALP